MCGISKRFGGVHALRDVDLTLEVGEVHCLVGENGSGKSTLIKIISGVEEPERGGRIAISGKEYPKLNPVRSTHCGIQVIYQDLSLFPNLNVAERVTVLRDGMKVGTFAAATIDDRKLSHLMTGKAFEYQVQARGFAASPVVLEVEDLGRDGDYHDVSFQLRAGEVLGLTGLLG